MRRSDGIRDAFFVDRAIGDSIDGFRKHAAGFRRYAWQDVIGRVDEPLLPLNPRQRQVYDEPG